MRTGIITTDTYLNHDTGQGHPERADRVTVVIDHLKKIKSKNLIWKKPKKFDLKYLEYAHDKSYLDNVTESFPKQGLIISSIWSIGVFISSSIKTSLSLTPDH